MSAPSIVKIKLLQPAGGGAQEREMAAVERNGRFLCFWLVTEPEIIRQFEGRDFAWFEAEGDYPDIRILLRDNAGMLVCLQLE